jgi:hypothetical protein
MYTSIMTKERTTTPSSISTTSSLMELGDNVDERKNLTTLSVIHLLCPPHTRGGTFFARLLAKATDTSQALPGIPKEVRGDAAVVSVQGCAELSRLVHLSYDTTQKYLAIYRALDLLSIEKQGKLSTITIPLTIYHSPGELVDRLQQLREHYLHKRPKMRSLINNMIERAASLAQEDEEGLPLAGQGQTLPNSRELLTPIQQVLFSEGVADPGGRIAMRILEAFARATNGNPTKNLSSFASENLPNQQENMSKVDSTAGESTPRTVAVLSPSRCPGGDRELIANSNVLRGSTKCSRSIVSNLPTDQQTSEEMEPGSAEDGRYVMGNLTTNQQTERASHDPPVAAEDPYVQIKGACKMPDGTYAVKVIIDPVEYYFRSVEDWEIYSTEMQALDQEVVSR